MHGQLFFQVLKLQGICMLFFFPSIERSLVTSGQQFCFAANFMAPHCNTVAHNQPADSHPAPLRVECPLAQVRVYPVTA
jgi:hypothetical protein